VSAQSISTPRKSSEPDPKPTGSSYADVLRHHSAGWLGNSFPQVNAARKLDTHLPPHTKSAHLTTRRLRSFSETSPANARTPRLRSPPHRRSTLLALARTWC
jgi:hypothetical protein